MNYYIAKIVFRITTAQPGALGQFDEHLRLIHATTFEEAFRKARLIGIGEEDPSQDGDASWEFVNIAELFPLQQLCDGAELYSRIHETPEVRSYINLVHLKAAELAR
ncbi:MAG: DUF4288 domain-containing protein [Cyclobacteriaceae bacterium]|nr:DUF4288 domain-containing protein [Cyclobacteriaceae bacterium]